MDVERALKNISSLLKDDGYVFIAVPWLSELVNVSFGLKVPYR